MNPTRNLLFGASGLTFVCGPSSDVFLDIGGLDINGNCYGWHGGPLGHIQTGRSTFPNIVPN